MAENKNKGTSTQGSQGQQFQDQGAQGDAGRGGQGGQGGQGGEGTMTGVAQMARDAASSVSQAASGAASSVADQAKHAASSVAGGMHSLAGTIREHAPSQGVLGTAAGTVADTLDSSSRYLQEEGLNRLVDDMAGMVRRNPISCMCVCLGVGFVLGWALAPHSSSRS
jgi:hypothetical protein